jgi:hypothetical protein
MTELGGDPVFSDAGSGDPVVFTSRAEVSRLIFAALLLAYSSRMNLRTMTRRLLLAMKPRAPAWMRA